MKMGVMFLIPPSEFSERFFKINKKHFLGILGDKQAAQTQMMKYNSTRGSN
jgi:hypothetical protein